MDISTLVAANLVKDQASTSHTTGEDDYYQRFAGKSLPKPSLMLGLLKSLKLPLVRGLREA